MKELSAHSKNQIAVHAPVVKKERDRYLYSLNMKPGLTCFEYDIVNDVIRKAVFNSTSAFFKGGINHKIIRKPHHLYCVALNEKCATEKFSNQLIDILKKKKVI